MADLRKQAEDLKFKDPKASAALYAQIVASDATPAEQATDLDNQADELLRVSDWKTADPLARQALDLCKQVPDMSGQGKSMRIIASALTQQGKYQEAIGLCKDAIVLDENVHADLEEANASRVEGNVDFDLSRYSNALAQFDKALLTYRRFGANNDEAKTLADIGNVYNNLGQYSTAINIYTKTLPIYRDTSDKEGEAKVIVNIGGIYLELGQCSKAIGNFTQALQIYGAVGDRYGEAGAQNDIGLAYDALSQYSKAIESYNKALSIHRSDGDKAGEAGTLTNLGSAYDDLRQCSKAIDSYNQALLIFRSVGGKDGEAAALTNIGNTYADLSQYSKAIGYYNQALPVFRSIGDKDDQALALNDIGTAYNDLMQYSRSLAYYTLALPILHAIGDIDVEAKVLGNLGNAYDHLGQYNKAMDNYDQALPVFRRDGDKDNEAELLLSVFKVYRDKKNPSHNLRLAVYYGKQFVNIVQSIRRSNATLDKSSSTSYVNSKASGYRELADLLIQQGRLPEAQQVLRLLKDREFYDFLHSQNDEDNAMPAEPIALTPREKRWSHAYDAAAAHLEDLQSQFDALNQLSAPTDADRVRMANLKSQVNVADTNVESLLAKTAKSFAEPLSQQDRLPDTAIAGDVAAALKPQEAALYTIVSPDRLDLILILPSIRDHEMPPKVYASQIKQADLYQQVYRLRTALTDTQVDPRPLASSLYDLVLRPVKHDLVAAHIKTILFSLDDALRYIPPAVLYDNETKRYVVQDYATALITLAGKPATANKTALAPEIIGAGVSQSPGSTDPPLPGVRKELDGIVHQDGDAAGSGLYPGTRMLDSRFTRAALEGSLAAHRYPMVHLASHFLLHDTDADSYLLLGDGTQLSVQDIRQDPKRFADVDLLTLSACDTAMDVKSSTGREVEGLGALALSLGAKAVLASLWPVSDTETPKLMIAFYAYHKAHPTVALPDALRQAQLSLLEGKGTTISEAGGSARGTKMVGVVDPKWRSFKANASAPDAHPYYWAPFVLLGDWK